MLPKEVTDQRQKIKKFLETLSIPVDNIKDDILMIQSFVHKSFAADYKHILLHNERLEFLGDGILGAIINKLLFTDYPDYPESELTLYKIALVREETLADVAREIQLDAYIFVSKGEERNQGRNKNSILSDCLEALIGFIYYDLGEKIAEDFIRKFIFTKISIITKEPVKSYKTMIQEYIQKEYKILPIYKDIEHEIDQETNNITYLSEIYIGDKKVAEGFGLNKKKAQEDAAKSYYNLLFSQN